MRPSAEFSFAPHSVRTQPVRMPTTVDALLPLSFLEAVRAVDRPVDDPDTEFVAELRNKRLGLSDTVHAQIRRYTDLVRRRQRLRADEAGGLGGGLGGRPGGGE